MRSSWSCAAKGKFIITSLFVRLSRPEYSEGTFRSSSQATSCPLVYHTRWRLQTVPFVAELGGKRTLLLVKNFQEQEKNKNNCRMCSNFMSNVAQICLIQLVMKKQLERYRQVILLKLSKLNPKSIQCDISDFSHLESPNRDFWLNLVNQKLEENTPDVHSCDLIVRSYESYDLTFTPAILRYCNLR